MHSRSPRLHNYRFARYDLAGAYVPLAIKPEDLEAALRTKGLDMIADDLVQHADCGSARLVAWGRSNYVGP